MRENERYEMTTAVATTAPAAVTAFGPRIRELRSERGISVRGLAEQVAISASELSQVERGLTVPSLPIAERSATGLGYSLADVLGSAGEGRQ